MSFYTKNKEGILAEVPIGKVETLLNNDVKIYSDKDLISELSLKVGKLQEQNKELIETLEFVKDTLDKERINLGMIKAIDACVFHVLAKVKE